MTKIITKSTLFWVLFILLLVASGFLSNSFLPHDLSKFGYGILGSLSAVLVTWIFLRTDKQSFRDIGLVWDVKTVARFFAGLLIGALIFGLIVLALIAFSDIRFELNSGSFTVTMLIPYLAFLPLALMEEIGFRGYTFYKLNKATGLLMTQFIVAVAFALYHIANGWSIEAAFLGTFVWAWVFGLGAAWSDGIALPTGIHVAVNVLQGLTGMKEGNSIWVVVFEEKKAGGTLAEADQVGLISQVLILVFAVALTIFYVRRNSK